jgi:hypothetical protein
MKIDTTIPGTSAQILNKIPSFLKKRIDGGLDMAQIFAWFRRGNDTGAEAITGKVLNEGDDEVRALDTVVRNGEGEITDLSKYKISGTEQRFNTSQEIVTMSGSALAVDNTGGLMDIKVTVNSKFKIVPAGELFGPDILNFGAFTSFKIDVPTGYTNISDDGKFGVMPYD